MLAYNKNLVNFDKTNDSKHCIYSRQHIYLCILEK